MCDREIDGRDSGSPTRQPIIRIMLVDDDPDALVAIGEMLVFLGFEIIPAANAEEAVVHLETHFCDVLLSDVQMPGMSGLQLAKWVGARYPETQIILTSCSASAPLAKKWGCG